MVDGGVCLALAAHCPVALANRKFDTGVIMENQMEKKMDNEMETGIQLIRIRVM